MEKETKKRVNSKSKGNGFENTVAKKLSKTFEPYNFKRVPNSGAQLGGINAALLEKYSAEIANVFVGDVICINEGENEKFRFNIECKFYKDVEHLEQLFNNTKIPGWLNESKIDAAKTGKTPFLVFKFNRTKEYIAVYEDVETPEGIPFMILPQGVKVLQLDLLLDPEHRSWWWNTVEQE